MKTISLWQPWASAIAIGAKTIETRSWETSYRGPLAIHAAKRNTPELRRFFNDMCYQLHDFGYTAFIDLPFGEIVATCDLIDCRPSAKVYQEIMPQERRFGDYSAGRFAWILSNINRLETPIPFKGSQGFFECPLIGEPTP